MALRPLLLDQPQYLLRANQKVDLKPHMHERQYANLWHLEEQSANTMPVEIRELFERAGHGCLAVESNIGIVHVCHAADEDIANFVDKPTMYQWQLIQMPTAPLVCLEMMILDDPDQPYMFESSLNVADEEQLQILAHLAGQAYLHLAFFGSDFSYHFTQTLPQDMYTWQYLDEITAAALTHYNNIPPNMQDYDLAKAVFMQHYP